MNRALLIIYEPGLFLVAGLGWAAWELWSMRNRKTKRQVESPVERRARPLEPTSNADQSGET